MGVSDPKQDWVKDAAKRAADAAQAAQQSSQAQPHFLGLEPKPYN